MNPLLHHANLVTVSRNRGVTEAAVVAAISEILGAERTELYKIFMPPGDILVGLTAEMTRGDPAGVISHDDGFSWPEHVGSIDHYPAFQPCLATAAPCRETLPNGHVRTMVLIRNDRHEPHAFLVVERATPLTEADTDIVHGFARLLQNCLAMLDYSETDSLTGLLNRKTFDEYLIRILASVPLQDDTAALALHLPQRRHAHPEARNHWLGVMDIDHFKSINDRFGHLIGDEVLILMANFMRENFRLQDKLFRFGGEEFVALLRPAELSHARGIFERFRTKVESFLFPQVGTVTISIGFTRINLGDTPSVVLDNADEALYWAKEHGRNQCHCYETLIAEGRIATHQTATSDFEMF